MYSLLKRIAKIGIITEPVEVDQEFHQIATEVKQRIRKLFSNSLAIRAIDSGSCNGCELEIHAINNAFYDAERYGIHFVASPRHADILLITGGVSRHMEEAIARAYVAMPQPKWVIACGDCAKDGGIYGNNYAMQGGVNKILKVDFVIPGCPPTPLALMQGLLSFMQQLKLNK
jgi:Ni,Fe-hydrogenase III small subunit